MAKLTTKRPSKREQLRKLISRKSGATLGALEKQLSWKPHSVRAEISRLRKSGLDVSCRPSPKGPIYKVLVAEPAK